MLIFGIFLFLLLSALFSGAEIAFISASKLRVELKRKKGSRRGEVLASFYEKPADFLSSMLVGNNISLVIFTVLMTKLLDPIVAPITGQLLLLLVNTIITTLVVLIFGEFLPKTLFRLFANEVLNFLAYPLLFFKYLLAIPSWLMMRLSNTFLKIFFKTSVGEVEQAYTRLDLEIFIKDTRTADSVEDIDTNLFEKALYLKKIKVKECMIPRPEIEEIDASASIEELLQKFNATNLSRLIIIDGDIDHVLGYAHHQQLWTDPQSIDEKLIIPIPFVPEVMRVSALMNKFIKERINIACVVDEFGGTAGIVTMEDILEEIFGEIEDEHDQEEYIESVISADEYIFSGRLEINYLNEKYENINFPEGEYHTLSGYLVTATATIPEQGSAIELDGYKFVLELMSDTKIETIRVQKLAHDDEEMD
ncbi:MAG: hemolysin family protein [Saprospiraceae bacterium]